MPCCVLFFSNSYSHHPLDSFDASELGPFLDSLGDASGEHCARVTSGVRAWTSGLRAGNDEGKLNAALTIPYEGDEANSYRYGLMIADVLENHPAFTKRAQRMRDSILEVLSNTPLSPTDENESRASRTIRLRNQYHLSYACYRKAQILESAGRASEATPWYARAFAGAPEEGHETFHEIHVMGGPQNFVEAYVKNLCSLGQQDKALTELTKAAVGRESARQKLRELFQQLRPSSDFDAYWKTAFLRSLPEAPEFSLRSITGATLRLSDFRGKWVLVDFWGTWCPPCVQQMPALDSFYLEMARRRPHDVAVISIACRDEIGTVRKFMQSRSFAFPVVMTNQQVERDYKIRGYPSHFLITPEGRSISLGHFGWESKVSTYIDG